MDDESYYGCGSTTMVLGQNNKTIVLGRKSTKLLLEFPSFSFSSSAVVDKQLPSDYTAIVANTFTNSKAEEGPSQQHLLRSSLLSRLPEVSPIAGFSSSNAKFLARSDTLAANVGDLNDLLALEDLLADLCEEEEEFFLTDDDSSSSISTYLFADAMGEQQIPISNTSPNPHGEGILCQHAGRTNNSTLVDVAMIIGEPFEMSSKIRSVDANCQTNANLNSTNAGVKKHVKMLLKRRNCCDFVKCLARQNCCILEDVISATKSLQRRNCRDFAKFLERQNCCEFAKCLERQNCCEFDDEDGCFYFRSWKC